MRKLIVALLIILALPCAFAEYDDRYFSVKDNSGPYTALPGDTIVVEFTLANRDLVYPRNVTAYLDPCPVGWKCSSKTVSYSSDGVYPENLTIEIPSTASPKMYTFYILLSSEYWTKRGSDRFTVDVADEIKARTVSYEEYSSRSSEQPKNPALAAVNASAPRRQTVVEQPLVEGEGAPSIIPDINTTDVVDTVERMESSRHFKEYISVVLVVVLVFIAAGGYMAFKKKEKKK